MTLLENRYSGTSTKKKEHKNTGSKFNVPNLTKLKKFKWFSGSSFDRKNLKKISVISDNKINILEFFKWKLLQ